MPVPHTNIEKLTDHLFRIEAGKMVSVLTRIFGTEHLELAEDVVQETFISAIKVWSLKGIPDNPPAWLFRAAKNKAIDVVRRNKFSVQFDFSDPGRQLLRSEYTLSYAMEELWKDKEIEDDLLRMMYACCDKGIPAASQVSLVLKTLCGFSVAEIAKAFLTSEETISKRLYRTKEFFREKKIRPQFPGTTELKDRTEAVLKAIYLIFNEGYNSTHSEELIRRDLIAQAMYLCRLLCDNSQTQLPEVLAAMALMCFHAARTDSRTGSEGEIILLAAQDRTKWNAALIAEGNAYMNRASFGNALSSYHIEAAIAWEHCKAPGFEHTNWKQILDYYNWLVQMQPSAVVELNRMSVLFILNGAQSTLGEMERSPYLRDWEKQYLYYALMGDMHAGSDKATARIYYGQAIELTQSGAEKKLLQRKIAELSVQK